MAEAVQYFRIYMGKVCPLSILLHQFYRLCYQQLYINIFIMAAQSSIEVAASQAEILQSASSLSPFLNTEDLSRIVEGSPIQKCSHPIALQVCRESRRHTLTQYQSISMRILG
jgi:hypothetical protein